MSAILAAIAVVLWFGLVFAHEDAPAFLWRCLFVPIMVSILVLINVIGWLTGSRMTINVDR